MEHYSTRWNLFSTIYICAIGLKTKMCWLISADARPIPENKTLLDGTSSPCVYNRVKTKKCWLTSADARLIPKDGTLIDGTSLLRMCKIGLNTKKCWLTSADARLISEDGTLLDGTYSPHAYNRVKNKNVLTHLCWCPPFPENGTLRDGTSSPRVYNRVKHKEVLTHLCWCPPHPWGWNTPRWARRPGTSAWSPPRSASSKPFPRTAFALKSEKNRNFSNFFRIIILH